MVCVTNIRLSSYRNKFSGCFRAKFSGARRIFCGARGKMRGARRKIYSPSKKIYSPSRKFYTASSFSCVAWGEAGARGKVVWVASQASCEEAGIRTPRLSRPHGRRTMGCIGVGVRRLCQFCAPIADILLEKVCSAILTNREHEWNNHI